MKPCIQIQTSTFDVFSVQMQCCPTFLDLADGDELFATSDVEIVGQVCCVEKSILFRGNVRACFSLPCAVCNERFNLDVSLTEWMHEEAWQKVQGRKWDLSEPIREALLLQVPFYPRCGGEECCHREEIDQFLYSGARPFENLEKIIS